MSADQHLQAVGEIYAAFGRGDVPFILSQLADDVAWEAFTDNHAQAAGVPWLAARSDPASVGQFFAILGSWDVHSFHVHDLLASGGGQVAAEIEIDATTGDGRHFHDEEMHLWTFGADGKVTRFRHYTDTAKHMSVAGIAVGAEAS